jgi:hypothetical protein
VSNKPTEPNNLNTALLAWCQANQVDATSLAKSTGFTYLHAWRLLSGNSPVTAETLGRFVLAYGAQAAGELVTLAELNYAKAAILSRSTHTQPGSLVSNLDQSATPDTDIAKKKPEQGE